jgi:putative methyltransferase (TIGR04325 family)
MVNKPPIEKKSFIWDGPYSTWEEACNVANGPGNKGGGLNSSRWLKRITQQLSDYRNEFKKYGVAIPPRPCNLPLICAITNPRTIIEFGGSSGWSWEYLKNSLTKNGIGSYLIIETKLVCDHMNSLGAHEAPVSYKTQENSLKCCDLLYSNSVLQYLNSNGLLISIVKRSKPKYIFLEDTVGKKKKEFFSTQRYYNSKIPYRFISLHKMIKELGGYAEVARFPYATPIHGLITPLGMENFTKENRIRYASSILMKRVSN